MNAKELRNKFAAKETELLKKEFLAPYTESSVSAHVKIDGAVYPFRIVGQSGHGFGIFKPIDGTCAKFVRPAPIDTTRAFLNILPQIHLILCYETDQGWVGYPMNAESARKSIKLNSEAIVKNVTDCQRFDVIVARFDGINFWYDDIFVGADPMKAEAMRDCFKASFLPTQMKSALNKIKSLTPEERKSFDLAMASWSLFKKMTTEQRLKALLERSGATLDRYILRGVNVELKWLSEAGDTYVSVVNKDTLQVVSAGVCLSGQDQNFHLKDLPYLIREGESSGKIYRTRYESDYAAQHERDFDIEDE